MITAIVEFKLPQPISRERARATFLGAAPALTCLECPAVVDNLTHEVIAD